jgi:putative PIG3 family NAD(P)H quinone oxidoreductase
MRAIRIDNPGPEYRLKIEDVPEPVAGPADVIIRVAAAGVNRADLLQAQGRYPPPKGASPILGLEVAGEVVGLGENASAFAVGDRVCALLAGGGYAEVCAASEGSVLPVPEGIELRDAAALPEVHFTVWTNLMDSARLAAGERVLIHGGTSGIGTAAIQLCAALGHNVFATAGTPEKCAACVKLGATRAINYRGEDFVEAIAEATGGRGVDVILDMVGGDYIGRNLRALARAGRLVNIAFQKGAVAEVASGEARRGKAPNPGCGASPCVAADRKRPRPARYRPCLPVGRGPRGPRAHGGGGPHWKDSADCLSNFLSIRTLLG